MTKKFLFNLPVYKQGVDLNLCLQFNDDLVSALKQQIGLYDEAARRLGQLASLAENHKITVTASEHSIYITEIDDVAKEYLIGTGFLTPVKEYWTDEVSSVPSLALDNEYLDNEYDDEYEYSQYDYERGED